jgi:hypothetical protein
MPHHGRGERARSPGNSKLSVTVGDSLVWIAFVRATRWGATCNATDTRGCSQTPGEDGVGNYPAFIALDPAIGTDYVSNIKSVSVIPIRHGTAQSLDASWFSAATSSWPSPIPCRSRTSDSSLVSRRETAPHAGESGS